ncbi:prepilin-type N-terminal cleavage/methylation domain-containing protein [Planomicrobium sp. CPCC 101110]|uniref:type IV pilus modification PilV family protein n=1 Tax=Planomicrobium sp. CPCC 101110 TaxID=2599619 RepID=UPI0011B4F4CA|nr:type II secretion system protein [Planomicrobium sp. CPCC 101110]TWT26277.1 type II secretion system protein [Planomicrobium sp. CPCC 101110]
MKRVDNEKGLTLVEVLAALVILSILFVGIMTIFPQMTLFNAKTETKLDTMNLARQEMAKIVAADKWKKILVPSAVTPDTGMPDYLSKQKIIDQMAIDGYAVDSETADFIRFKKTDGYLYETDIYLKCEVYLNPVSIGEEPAPGICGKLEPTKLHKVHLRVYKESGAASGGYSLSSETYSFLSYRAYADPAESSGG